MNVKTCRALFELVVLVGSAALPPLWLSGIGESEASIWLSCLAGVTGLFAGPTPLSGS